MKSRIKDVYQTIGRVLNNPTAFGLGERAPRALEDELTRTRLELMEELREEMSDEEFLVTELSQDADRHAFPGVTSTSFSLRKTGT
jgi:hypothetical protein